MSIYLGDIYSVLGFNKLAVCASTTRLKTNITRNTKLLKRAITSKHVISVRTEDSAVWADWLKQDMYIHLPSPGGYIKYSLT